MLLHGVCRFEVGTDLRVDFVPRTADLTRNSILQQAATSVLAQANVQPQLALNLLG